MPPLPASTPFRDVIVRALTRAGEATVADSQHDYPTAVVLYQEVISDLDAVLEAAATGTVEGFGVQERDRLTDIFCGYVERLEYLLANLPEDQEQSLNAFQFEEIEPVGTLPEAPPASIHLRPYWLMKTLHRTMTTGGFLTPKLYVHSKVWVQFGARFTAIETKFNSCETILSYLRKLKESDINNSNALQKDLDEFCIQLDSIQNQLARKLAFVPEIKDKKAAKNATSVQMTSRWAQMLGQKISISMERMHATYSKEKIDDDSAYIALLVALFETSQFFPSWYSYYESKGAASVITRLNRVSEFMYQVVCAFVIRDFNMLLERYMKKTRHAFVESSLPGI